MLVFIEAKDFRNFAQFSIEPSPRFNIICGLNGSGKSSVLEAVYFLALARSFRTHLTTHIIQHQKALTTVFGTIKNDSSLKTAVGIQKARSGGTEIHINGELSKTAISLAKILPTILINPDSYELIHGGPNARRHFLNWGAFHVEQSFISIWRSFQRCLKQRNTALKMELPLREVQFWDNEFVNLSLALDQIYLGYVEKLIPEVQSIIVSLTDLEGLSLEYYSGWSHQDSLEYLLKNNSAREQQQHCTLFGPHRADLKINFKGAPAQEILSRGEQKLLIFALQLAQAKLLNKMVGTKAIYLIDDMAAELDASHRKKIVDFLISLDAQVFLTCLEPKQLSFDIPSEELKMFYVEHGKFQINI